MRMWEWVAGVYPGFQRGGAQIRLQMKRWGGGGGGGLQTSLRQRSTCGRVMNN